MQIFVRYEIFESIIGEHIASARQAILARLKSLQDSGRIELGGAFADARAGFFVVNASSSEEMFDLIGDLIHSCRLESHPMITLSALLDLGEASKPHVSKSPPKAH